MLRQRGLHRAGILFAGLFLLSATSHDARAQMAPGAQPDVVLECFANNILQPRCDFSCGATLALGNTHAEGTVTGTRVWRVELYGRGAGRTDGRMWLMIRYAQEGTSFEMTHFYNLGANVSCSFPGYSRVSPSESIGFRPTRFTQ